MPNDDSQSIADHVLPIASILSLLLLAGCQSSHLPSTALLGQVERVLSGQSLEVRLANPPPTLAKIVKVRLWGIESPTRYQQAWGDQARQFLLTQLQTQTVAVLPVQPTPDPWGRLPAYVWVQNQLLNESLVAQGHALITASTSESLNPAFNTQYDQRLAWAQQRARLLGLGIWNPKAPLRQAPSEFRRQLSTPHL